MPYIKPEARLRLGEDPVPLTPGELNYLISLAVRDYIREVGESYSAYNAAIGALEAAKMELYRRHVAPYEDIKIAENGDI